MSNDKLASAYNRLRSWLNTFVVITRYLIGFAFIPSGLKKIMGERFTQIGINNPIGFFFEGLYQAGFYWNFIGWAQVIAALLLMTQRFATLGAICFFFIVSNIWVITISLHFSGTWVITSLMLLAVIMLLVWDYDKWKYIFYKEPYTASARPSYYPASAKIWTVTGFILFAWSLVGMLFLERQASNKLFSSVWLAGILITVLLTLFLSRKNKRQIM